MISGQLKPSQCSKIIQYIEQNKNNPDFNKKEQFYSLIQKVKANPEFMDTIEIKRKDLPDRYNIKDYLSANLLNPL